MDNTCEDFLAFQELLKKKRKIDDNIIHLLNTTLPTDSFANRSAGAGQHCQQLHQQIQDSYKEREGLIKGCINVVSTRVRRLKDERGVNEDNLEVLKNLRKEQKNLRLMQSELNVEEVVKDRTLKVFHERCRSFYSSKDINL